MNLNEFFFQYPTVALAFSGGVDSAYLLYSAVQAGAKVRAYYVKSAFQPQFELEDAMQLAKELHADLKILTVDALCNEKVAENPKDRCYYCKQGIFGEILKNAREDGFSVILDGTNASDDSADRPGMRALQEMQVLSPLRLCGLTKTEIREKSREAGLFTWDKPAYACLATRISTGQRITEEKLMRTELAEGYLFSLGFRDFRVRTMENSAKLQLRQEQLPLLMENREVILKTLKQHYDSVLLDMEVRK